jgi:hypothetical protein
VFGIDLDKLVDLMDYDPYSFKERYDGGDLCIDDEELLTLLKRWKRFTYDNYIDEEDFIFEFEEEE